MTNRIALIIVGVVLCLAGCRQPDGIVPAVDEENANRITDVANDLRAVGRGDEDGRRGLVDDLAVFPDEHNPTAVAAARGFGEKVADALAGVDLNDEQAEKVARSCWTLVAVSDLSDRQVEALQQELGGHLREIGVPEDRVATLVAEMPAVQQGITSRPRRWYELF